MMNASSNRWFTIEFKSRSTLFATTSQIKSASIGWMVCWNRGCLLKDKSFLLECKKSFCLFSNTYELHVLVALRCNFDRNYRYSRHLWASDPDLYRLVVVHSFRSRCPCDRHIVRNLDAFRYSEPFDCHWLEWLACFVGCNDDVMMEGSKNRWENEEKLVPVR